MPLVIFGDGLKGSSHVKFKGRRVGVSNIIYKNLKRREKLGELLVLDIDEFRTSSVSNLTRSSTIMMHLNLLLQQVCHECNETSLRHHRDQNRAIFSILICNNCNIFWNRDVLASKNMMFIAAQIWAGIERPAIFTRQNRQRATSNVVVPHPGERT